MWATGSRTSRCCTPRFARPSEDRQLSTTQMTTSTSASTSTTSTSTSASTSTPPPLQVCGLPAAFPVAKALLNTEAVKRERVAALQAYLRSAVAAAPPPPTTRPAVCRRAAARPRGLPRRRFQGGPPACV